MLKPDVDMDADKALRLIVARVPELSARELGVIEAALSGQTLPTSALGDVMTLIEALEERLDGFMEGRWTAFSPDEGLRLNARQRLS